jgi:hypothetical protein
MVAQQGRYIVCKLFRLLDRLLSSSATVPATVASSMFQPAELEAPIPAEYHVLIRVQGIGGTLCSLLSGDVYGWLERTVRGLVVDGDIYPLLTMFSTLTTCHLQIRQCQDVAWDGQELWVAQKVLVLREMDHYGLAMEWAMNVLLDIGRSHAEGSLVVRWLQGNLLYQRC